jgi:hypothetical protein
MKSRILSAFLIRKAFNNLCRQYGIATKMPVFIPPKERPRAEPTDATDLGNSLIARFIRVESGDTINMFKR